MIRLCARSSTHMCWFLYTKSRSSFTFIWAAWFVLYLFTIGMFIFLFASQHSTAQRHTKPNEAAENATHDRKRFIFELKESEKERERHTHLYKKSSDHDRDSFILVHWITLMNKVSICIWRFRSGNPCTETIHSDKEKDRTEKKITADCIIYDTKKERWTTHTQRLPRLQHRLIPKFGASFYGSCNMLFLMWIHCMAVRSLVLFLFRFEINTRFGSCDWAQSASAEFDQTILPIFALKFGTAHFAYNLIHFETLCETKWFYSKSTRVLRVTWS